MCFGREGNEGEETDAKGTRLQRNWCDDKEERGKQFESGVTEGKTHSDTETSK